MGWLWVGLVVLLVVVVVKVVVVMVAMESGWRLGLVSLCVGFGYATMLGLWAWEEWLGLEK